MEESRGEWRRVEENERKWTDPSAVYSSTAVADDEGDSHFSSSILQYHKQGEKVHSKLSSSQVSREKNEISGSARTDISAP